jgi:hypothetical protein
LVLDSTIQWRLQKRKRLAVNPFEDEYEIVLWILLSETINCSYNRHEPLN